ncbi:DUF4870 domain-containing protein [Thalassotalea sp. ND16A]|uniref:DUF4870 domain-containing protein n=1 Tax=Thalassotalea sp. ND16A TaxID=1535422 RepID=UPI00051A6C13|nr:hypothetical protein [Thalassotalea sp. ND16A]KGJ99685.1 hypothetical protein ND16A_3785 [Thalassotalea sp. ND16A]
MTQYHVDDKAFKADGKTIAIISYLTIIGWVVALVLHGNNPTNLAAFHLRQSLGLFLTWVVLSFIPIIGWIFALPVLILWGIGLYHAFHENITPVAVIGEFFQRSFNTLIE